MDPVSILTGVTGSLAVCLDAAKALHRYVKDIQNAPDQLESIAEDLDSLTKTLSSLEELLESGSINPAIAGNIDSLVQNGVDSINAVRKFIAPYVKPKEDGQSLKWRYISWTLFKKSSLLPLQQRLQQVQVSLQLRLDVVTMRAVNDGHTHIRNDISILDARLEARDNEKVDLASTYATTSSVWGGTAPRLTLDRYIENLPAGGTAETTWTADDDSVDPSDRLSEVDGLNSITSESHEDLEQTALGGSPTSEKSRHTLVSTAEGPNEAAVEVASSTSKLQAPILQDLLSVEDYHDLCSVLNLEASQSKETARQLSSRLLRSHNFASLATILSVLQANLDPLLSQEARISLIDVLTFLVSLDWRRPVMNHVIRTGRWDNHTLKYISTLLQAGASANEIGESRFAPLHWAVWLKKYELAELLLNNGADIDLTGPEDRVDHHSPLGGCRTALHLAASKPDMRMMKLLIDRGADVNALDSNGSTAIQSLGAYPPSYSELLIVAGADIRNAKTSQTAPYQGYQVVHWSVQCKNLDLLKYLLDKGADVNAATASGLTPLHLAADFDFANGVRYLVAYPGCQVSARDNQGKTAEDHARFRKSNKALEVLRGG